jgi:DNA-binding transcriptional LysR family regulator
LTVLLRQLEYLTALAQEGHFGRAADACHVSQPALSAGIRKLETELGVQVVQRGQRFEGFTPEGEQVLRWAQRILAERQSLDQTLSSMRGALSGTLRIGAIPTALSIVSILTAPMREQHPLVSFSLESMSSREIVARLNDFDIDVGMTYVDGEPLGGVRVVPLYRERYLFLTRADSAYAGRDAISWAEAGAAPLCLLLPVMQNRRIIDGYFTEAGAQVRPVVETDTVSAVYAHVAAMGLSSVIPHTWLHDFGVPPGLHAIPLPQPQRSFHVGLVLAGRGLESLLAQRIVEMALSTNVRAQVDRDLKDLLARNRTSHS